MFHLPQVRPFDVRQGDQVHYDLQSNHKFLLKEMILISDINNIKDQ